MISTRSWLIGLPTLAVAAAVCIGLASPPPSPVASPGPSVRVTDMLQALATGNVVLGPGVWSSDTAPQVLTVAAGLNSANAHWVTVANVGSTGIEIRVAGGPALATVAPHETRGLLIQYLLGPPPADALEFAATDVGSGSETRVVWVIRAQ